MRKGAYFCLDHSCTTDIVSSIDVVESDEIPASVLELAKAKRTELIEQLAEVDEEMGDMIINEEIPTNDHIASAIRRATVGLKFSPVFMGSAIKNTAVQPMLDGVCNYLANPSECDVVAHDTNLPISAPPVPLVPAAAAPFVGLAFKLEEGRFGQLTYIRVYQGTLAKGNLIYNAKTGKKVKVPRLVRMHSNEMEVSLNANLSTCPRFHLTSGCHFYWSWRDLRHLWSRVLLWRYFHRWLYKLLYGKNPRAINLQFLKVDHKLQTSMHVPEPVISLAIKPVGQESPNFAKALNRFRKEDPTFKIHYDNESKEVSSCSSTARLHVHAHWRLVDDHFWHG